MLYFQSVRTARFTFTLQELTNADSRALLNIPPDFMEKGRTEFLKRALKELSWHKGYEACTLDDLTVQERLLIEASYLSSTLETANFPLGNAHYADYLMVEKQYSQPSVVLGKMPNDDDVWEIKPLTGLMIEAMEERLLARERIERLDWILMAMAAQLFRENETLPDPKADFIAYGDWLEERAATFSTLPVSAFNPLVLLYFSGVEQLTHLFRINFDEEGVQIFPATETLTDEKGEEYALIPARFRTYATVDDFTKRLLGKFEQDSE